VALEIIVEDGGLRVKRRPDTVAPLLPVYADAFGGPFGFVRFHRDAAGRVTELSVVLDRAWDVRFARAESLSAAVR